MEPLTVGTPELRSALPTTASYQFQTTNSREFTLANHGTRGVTTLAPRRQGGPITFVYSL